MFIDVINKRIREPGALLKGLLIIIVILIGVAFYFYNQSLTLKADPERVVQDEVARVIEQVGELIILPTDEEPTVATVTNPERLQDQPFFLQAEEGDKVLIYTNARKAILFRPSSNKIIEVAPLQIGPGVNSESDTLDALDTPSVESGS